MEYRINTSTGKIWEKEEWREMDAFTGQTCIHWNHLDPFELPEGADIEEAQRRMYFIYKPPHVSFRPVMDQMRAYQIMYNTTMNKIKSTWNTG